MESWFVHYRARAAAKSPLGEALHYIAQYWGGLCDTPLRGLSGGCILAPLFADALDDLLRRRFPWSGFLLYAAC